MITERISFEQLLDKPWSKRWLVLAVLMLAGSGIFSLIIVFARTPGLYELPLVKKLFSEALVVHVDLLVLCWPLCIAGLMWAAFCPSKQHQIQQFINKASFALVGLGALCLVVSPLDMAAMPLKNNYIPMITSKIFSYGLLMIGLGAALLSVHAVLFNRRQVWNDFSLMALSNWAARGVGIIILFSLIAIYLGFMKTSPENLSPEQYYEYAYWAGGHIYQYAFTGLQMLAWVWLFSKITQRELPSYQGIRAIFLFNTLIAAVAIYGIFAYETHSFEYRSFYTMHMIIGGGLAPVLLLMTLIYLYVRHPGEERDLSRHQPPAYPWIPAFAGMTYLVPSLLASVGLFLYGGVLGLLIVGQDVTIPAHYHGSTISVTIALMGFAYAFLPYFTSRALPTRLMKWQPILYASGQFMHITGLAISGGYGALRKTPGVEGTAGAKAAMGFMGMGGLLALAGGLMFIYIMWVCLKAKPSTS